MVVHPARLLSCAVHIAIAVTTGVDFPVTWNFRHIANAVMRASAQRAPARSQDAGA